LTAALQVLGFLELPDDEQPDESIWGNPARLEEWFRVVQQRRENPGSGSEAVPQADEDMSRNELTEQLLRGE
jgi:hypothetical protein